MPSIGDRFRKNTSSKAADSQNDKLPLKTRMADKISDMKAKIDVNASKDMLAVARDSKEPMGSALNAQKSEKGEKGTGTYKYKTDALIKMLDGLVAKMDPQMAKQGSGLVKDRSAAILTRIRETALNSDDFKAGLAKGVAQAMSGYKKDPTLTAAARNTPSTGLAGKELKVLEEVLTTLSTRMSAHDDDKFGLQKNKPTQRDQSDRTEGNRALAQKLAPSRDAKEIEGARQSRVYHARLGKAVKNMSGALKETARSTGAALRTYTEPARRDVALGGLKAAKGAAEAADVAAKAAKQVVENLDEAQAHVVGATWGTVKGVGLAAAKAGIDLGKSTVRTGKDIVTGARDIVVHGANAAKDTHGAQVSRARARKSKGAKAEAPKPQATRPAAAASSRVAAEAPAQQPVPPARASSLPANNSSNTLVEQGARPGLKRVSSDGSLSTNATAGSARPASTPSEGGSSRSSSRASSVASFSTTRTSSDDEK